MAKKCRFVAYRSTRGGRDDTRTFPVSNEGWEQAVSAGAHAIGMRCPYGHRGEEGTISILLARNGKVVKPNLTKGERGYEDALAGLGALTAKQKAALRKRCKFGVITTGRRAGKCRKAPKRRK